jgi:Outer membrane protein beta-barrel domain
LRGAQGTQHPNTLAATGDLAFSLTLRDGAGHTSRINVGAYGGGLTEPYARNGGWHNEMQVIRVRLTDFLTNGSLLDLGNVAAVRLEVGPSFGANEGRIVVDELMLTNDVSTIGFTILEPTTARPKYAGTSMVGSRVLVRLLGGGSLDLSPGNMIIAVAGVPLTPAQIPTPAAQVSGETWVVIAPGPRPDGCYDLTVTLTSPAGLSAAQPQSLCYADDETHAFDRVLAIDKTNSMLFDGRTGLASTAKMDAARAAAKFFVDLSNPLDKIGVISFQRRDQDGDGSVTDPQELAEPEFAMVAAGEGGTDQRPAARAAVDAVSPDTTPGFTGPETSPGAGLVEARDMLDAGAVAGLENYPPKWNSPGAGGPLRPIFDSDDIRVDAVGVGQDADDDLLQDIAAVTDGQFRNLNEGSGSFELLSRLADWYKLVDEDVRGEQRFFYAEGFPTPTIPIKDKPLRVGFFDVEPSLDWMTVTFHANQDHAFAVQLWPPGASAPIIITPPAVTLREDPKHSVYRIRTPSAGRWFYLVDVSKPSAEFFAAASALTSLTARVGPRQLARRPSDYLMPIRVWIADSASVQGALVFGYVRDPNGVKVPVTLFDDGLHHDGGANDGIYGFGFPALFPGSYYVSLVATGTSNAGEAFTRYPWTSFVIPGAPKRPGENPPKPPGRGCNCEAEGRYSLAWYGGLTFPHGSFDSAADTSTSLGIKAAWHFGWIGGRASLGLYLGRDNFANASDGSGFHLTHLSPELEVSPWTRVCPLPSLHVGVGRYRDEASNEAWGFNVGAGVTYCLTDRLSLLGRYDYRRVNGLSREYSTLQIGLRWRF